MLTTLSLLLAAPAFAEDAAPIEVHAQVRPRLEFSTGKDGAAGAETFFVSQRTRLGVGATFPKVSLRVTFQDVRVWGSEANTLLDFTGDTIDLHEGWAQWTPNEHVGVKVGRQEIVVEEQRLIGAVDWTQQGRAFDAAVVRANGGTFSLDAGAAVLADTSSPVALTNALMGFVRAGVAPTKSSTVDVLAIVDTDETLERTRVTGGVYAQAGTGAFSGRVEAYGQVGSVGTSAIQSGMVGVRGTWAPPGGVEPSVTAWYDLLSGDADATDGKLTTFDTLYATNHKFYGLMDIVAFTVGGAIDGQGLHDGALKLGIKPVDGLGVNLDAHVFAAAAPAQKDTLTGEEADLWLSGKLGQRLSVAGGTSVFLWAADRQPDAWVWLQTTVEI
ncbi:MAG: alginate export family protein [Myxococcota bacterium]